MRNNTVLLFLATILSLGSSMAHASFIQNGDFEATKDGRNNLKLNGPSVKEKDRTELYGWTSSEFGNDRGVGGYNFLLNGSIANTNKSALWLEGDNNGYKASPTGGNFFASDSQYYPGVLSQKINNLTKGVDYILTFDYALAQQVGFVGANYDNFWEVGFGNATQSTTKLTIQDNEFSGWKSASMTFTATGASELLSFLAKGTAPGAPPFMLLDNVKLESAVPEPATLALMLGGVGLLGFSARRRRGSPA